MRLYRPTNVEHTVTLADGRVLRWQWHPDPTYPCLSSPWIDDHPAEEWSFRKLLFKVQHPDVLAERSRPGTWREWLATQYL